MIIVFNFVERYLVFSKSLRPYDTSWLHHVSWFCRFMIFYYEILIMLWQITKIVVLNINYVFNCCVHELPFRRAFDQNVPENLLRNTTSEKLVWVVREAVSLRNERATLFFMLLFYELPKGNPAQALPNTSYKL